MKLKLTIVFIAFVLAQASAAELKVSSSDPIVVLAPEGWTTATSNMPGGFPFATTRIVASGDRNAVCMISILDRNHPEMKNPEILKRILRGDSRPYLGSAEDAAKLDIKELPIQGGLGFYANFIDPDLVGKPVKKGSYKTATPIILSIGSDYLIKITILCDDLKGQDYEDAVQIVKSIKISK